MILRRLPVVLALLSLVIAGVWMARISPTDPWYRNLDMNMQNTADALAINSGLPPSLIDQPGVPMKLLLALDFRIRHYLGLLPVWNLQKFGGSPDPLRELPGLIRLGRVHSRILVLAFILAAAWFTYPVVRTLDGTSLTVILLCGNFSLLFHGLLTRPELLCVVLGNILALGCTWRAGAARHWTGNYGWLFLAGVFGGLAAMEKLPGVCYMALCYAWCWLRPLTSPADPGPVASREVGYWRGLVPFAGGTSALWLLFNVMKFHESFSHQAALRLRVAAVICGFLPLVALWHGGNRVGRFLLARAIELAVLAGGTLAALTLGYLGMRGVMTGRAASEYIGHVMQFMFDPAPTVMTLLDSPGLGPVLLQYFWQNPFLFFSTPLLAAGVCAVREIPLQLKAFILLVLAGALGMTLIMSQRHFTIHYNIFPQVPLLLVWSLGLGALAVWWRGRSSPPARMAWHSPALAAGAFAFVLTAFPGLKFRYDRYQDDANLPVGELSLTFLFDHDSHTATYRQIMSGHYGDRTQFARILEQYLSEPKNRY